MTLKNLERLILLLKENGVSYIKTVEVELRLDGQEVKSVPRGTKAPPAQAAPPVDIEIPHHVNEVANLLKLSDNDLVDKLFPDNQPKE